MSVYILRDSTIHGTGLFATEDISSEHVLIEYLGECIDRHEAERRESLRGSDDPTYIVMVDDQHFIDGAIGGNESIYINHSCDPNCTLDRQNLRVYIKTRQPIRSGEELTIDYAFDANTRHEICHCGSIHCRGTMNER